MRQNRNFLKNFFITHSANRSSKKTSRSLQVCTMHEFLKIIAKKYSECFPCTFNENDVPLLQSLVWNLLQSKKNLNDIKTIRKNIIIKENASELLPLQRMILSLVENS